MIKNTGDPGIIASIFMPVPEMLVDFLKENGYTNVFSSQRDQSFIHCHRRKEQWDSDEAIQVKNVLDFYNIDNFVETGTGAAEVVRSISTLRGLNIHTIEIEEI